MKYSKSMIVQLLLKMIVFQIDVFKFCKILLKKYKNDLRVAQISGNNFLNFKNFKRRNNDSYFFQKFTSSWGWATWKNRWHEIYDSNMKSW